MTKGERNTYFGHLWPEACLANEWDVKDEARRRAVTAEAMRLVRGPQTDSTGALGPDEITALFTYLRHLGNPASLDKSARWVTCQEDYRTFNRAKQADWHERETYGAGRNRLDRDRFGGAASAAGGPLEALDADEVRKRHLTVASRHQRKLRREKGQKLASQESASTAPSAPVRNESPKVDVPF
ncbi:MAG: hypothetical protein HZA93_29245 [Verrucomicrobia bacterium]|nr:hypothetical protein [Verrucomicrobiota bacterium]